ncbi:hypothetical protein ACWNS2_07880 [Planococcus plakortidis]
MKTIAGFIILMGVILLFADAELLAPLEGFAVYFIVGGLVMLAIAQLAGTARSIGCAGSGSMTLSARSGLKKFPQCAGIAASAAARENVRRRLSNFCIGKSQEFRFLAF